MHGTPPSTPNAPTANVRAPSWHKAASYCLRSLVFYEELEELDISREAKISKRCSTICCCYNLDPEDVFLDLFAFSPPHLSEHSAGGMVVFLRLARTTSGHRKHNLLGPSFYRCAHQFVLPQEATRENPGGHCFPIVVCVQLDWRADRFCTLPLHLD